MADRDVGVHDLAHARLDRGYERRAPFMIMALHAAVHPLPQRMADADLGLGAYIMCRLGKDEAKRPLIDPAAELVVDR